MRRNSTLFLALAGSLGCLGAFATPLTVINASPDWQSVASADGATFVLPWTIAGCGSEDETTCEPTGTFYFNQTWAGLPSYISLSDVTGGISDIITFDSLGPAGVFRILFFSDPTLPDAGFYSNYFYAGDFAETADGVVTAPLGICCITQGDLTLSVVLASDGEGAFDPFGFGADTSDGIQFRGAIDGTVPEPSTGLLVGLLGAAVLFVRRRIRT